MTDVTSGLQPRVRPPGLGSVAQSPFSVAPQAELFERANDGLMRKSNLPIGQNSVEAKDTVALEVSKHLRG
jgi:hypothetical protein